MLIACCYLSVIGLCGCLLCVVVCGGWCMLFVWVCWQRLVCVFWLGVLLLVMGLHGMLSCCL